MRGTAVLCTGGPISDHRITAADQHSVTFMAREGVRSGGDRRQVPITLSIEEFTRRWCLHVLPDQLTRTRYLGGWSNNQSAAYMERCKAILSELGRLESNQIPDLPDDNPDMLPDATPEPEAGPRCPHCQSTSLELLSETPKPSWRKVLWRESTTCPNWYAKLQQEEHRRFWTELHGEDFYDWYQQMCVESAKKPPPKPPPPIQPYLPGITPASGYELYSF